MPRLLVTGASGYLGGETARQALATGAAVVGTYHAAPGGVDGVDWRRLDVTDRDAVRDLVADVRPDAVVHTATGRAYHDWRAIADGAGHVALAATEIGARLVHVSSDAVFSGRGAPYDESALPDPVTGYGAAKAASETVVRVTTPDAAVVRTSLVLGDGRSKHERHVVDLVEGRIRGTLFTDEVRCPVHVADLAAALLELAGSEHSGVLNVAGADALTRYEIGVLVARRHGLDPARIPRGRSADAGSPRPTDTRLGITLARRLLRTRLRGAQEFLASGDVR